ncbi:MAG: 30S ribosomal protein S4 [Alphaproteobacteria bacterium]
MSKIVKSKYKKSRRLGGLWGTAKDPYLKKNYPPGQHGPTLQRKVSDYGKQLNAKQRLKSYYGRINEKQFRAIFKEAIRLKGDTGENLIGLLERRLDAIVYRLNIAKTIFAARQLVCHKHIKVNGKTVNYPSMRLKVGDLIEVKEDSKSIPVVIESTQQIDRTIPTYLEFDPKSMSGKFNMIPKLGDVPYPVVMEPNLVVELYSR